MNDKLSLIVPHWPIRPELDASLKRCVQAIDADEKIIVVNDGTGMGKAINKGLELATGDYLLVSNNDCFHSSGPIRDMCDPHFITVPDSMPGQGVMPRAFYCMPRWVYELVGGYDEQFQVGYFEDDDMIRRWMNAKVNIRIVRTVHVDHDPGTTLNNLPNRKEIFENNKALFEQKWEI